MRWQRALGGPALIAVTAVAGCGGSHHDSANDFDVVTAAYTKTLDTHSSRVALDESLSVGGVNVTVKADGVMDYRTKAAALKLAQGATEGTEMRLLGHDIYIRLPAGLNRTPGKPWTHISVASASKTFSPLGDGKNLQDPGTFLGYLQSTSNNVTKVGTESVRGADTTHYRADVDIRKAATHAGYSGAVGDQATKVFGPSVPEDVWIDHDGRVRRLRVGLSHLHVPNKATGATITATGTVTEEFYDFGTSVNVTPPPASQTAEQPIGATPATQPA